MEKNIFQKTLIVILEKKQKMLKRRTKLLDLLIFPKNPSDIKKYLSTDQSKLYELIWNRALSSQMTPAEFDRKSILIDII